MTDTQTLSHRNSQEPSARNAGQSLSLEGPKPRAPTLKGWPLPSLSLVSIFTLTWTHREVSLDVLASSLQYSQQIDPCLAWGRHSKYNYWMNGWSESRIWIFISPVTLCSYQRHRRFPVYSVSAWALSKCIAQPRSSQPLERPPLIDYYIFSLIFSYVIIPRVFLNVICVNLEVKQDQNTLYEIYRQVCTHSCHWLWVIAETTTIF